MVAITLYVSLFSYFLNSFPLKFNPCAIFLAPQVIQPPAGLYTVTFDESTTSVRLMCSLNIDIPSSVTVTWLYNSNAFDLGPSDVITQAGTTTTLILGNPQPSDAGAYQCIFGEFDQRIIQLG